LKSLGEAQNWFGRSSSIVVARVAEALQQINRAVDGHSRSSTKFLSGSK